MKNATIKPGDNITFPSGMGGVWDAVALRVYTHDNQCEPEPLGQQYVTARINNRQHPDAHNQLVDVRLDRVNLT